jgi:hypothetical protein
MRTMAAASQVRAHHAVLWPDKSAPTEQNILLLAKDFAGTSRLVQYQTTAAPAPGRTLPGCNRFVGRDGCSLIVAVLTTTLHTEEPDSRNLLG